MDDIETNLNYYDDDSNKLIQPIKVNIKNARSRDNKLDDCSFELTKHETVLREDDFHHNVDKIKKIYFDEIKILLMKVTGCSDVHIIQHNINNSNNNSNMIYTNYTPISAKALFLNSYQTIPPKTGAYSIVSAIRNISETPMNHSNVIALADERSIVKPDDYIQHNVKTENENSHQQYCLDSTNSFFHQWYYFSHMRNDEVLLVKEFDSRNDITGRICFRSEIKSDSQKYETIEVRALLYFADISFNTCPSKVIGKEYRSSPSSLAQEEYNSFGWLNGMFSWMIPTTKTVTVEEGVMKCESSLKYIKHWPREVILKIKNDVHKPEASLEFANDLVLDRYNILGLEQVPHATKQIIIQKLMERGFEEKFKKAFTEI